jgi:hypothetical protein
MKRLVVALLALSGMSCVAFAQTAQDIKSAAPETKPGETVEQHGKRLLDQMLVALGGDRWLNKQTSVIDGQTASFFRGEPNGSVVQFVQYKRYATGQVPEATRVEFLSWRGVITPGKKHDLIHLWANKQGYEMTYKGTTTLPEKQVAEYYRRQAHSLEEVMRTWVKQPDVVIVYEGSGTRDRRPVDKVSILAANNDSVTLEIEQDTHFPLQRAFRTRNEQFKDYDIDEEVYGDWRLYDGVATPMNLTTYKNGDMATQTFYTKVKFNEDLQPELFDKDKIVVKKSNAP